MSIFNEAFALRRQSRALPGLGLFWLGLAVLGAGLFFRPGLDALLVAWQKPEYSHGPLIPLLSGLLFLRQLKTVPERPGEIPHRWPGVLVVLLALMLGMVGRVSNIDDIVAYALIVWVGGLLLISFGWSTGKHFWPPVLHLVYMLPLPDTLYYKATTWLQFISSELGVWFLGLLAVPVYLEGNIIDLGVYKLHVAEACSGLRYLFPILSFSYIFAVLYRGPVWHKAVLLLSAAPITVLMNAVRIAIAGWMVDEFGVEWVEGFTHFFEGWVIFIICVAILFALARIMLFFHPAKMSLTEALDLDTEGLVPQLMRLRLVQPSLALIAAAGLMFAGVGVLQMLPDRSATAVVRDSFVTFPRRFGDWQQSGPPAVLAPDIARALQADDYHSITLTSPDTPAYVGVFLAWYADQSHGGVHPPEVCLPAGGWEIAWLERTDVASELGSAEPFHLNKAIIQKGEVRMMVYYWFDQKGRKVAWDFAAKLWLIVDALRTGRTDGALVRLTTPILPEESDADAAARLDAILEDMAPQLPRFIPED